MGCTSSKAGAASASMDLAVTVDYEDGDKAKDRVMAEKKLSAAFKAKRRGDIFVESIDPTRSLRLKTVVKSDEQRKLIRKALKKNMLFGEMDKTQLNHCVDCMTTKRVNAGVEVIKQGEDGDNFYVVESGAFVFTVDNSEVGKCGSGESFGELALLYNCPRAATVTAKENSSLFVLERSMFRSIVANGATKSAGQRKQALKRVPLLKGLNDDQIAKVADAVQHVRFTKGDTIIRKGDDGNIFYVITKGAVKCTKVGSGASNELTLSEGDYFGERALLTTEPRAANVIAASDVECLALIREDFNSLLGSLRDMLDDNLGFRVLNSLKILDKLSEKEIKELLSVFKKEHFKNGEAIINQDEPGDKFFIIREGNAEVVKRIPGASEAASITMLSNGDYFGEGALLKDEPRSASVISRGSVLCFVVQRADFEKAFGPLQEIMKRTMEDRDQTTEAVVQKTKSKLESDLKFDDLRVLHTLGTGTFGRVKLVEHRSSKKTFALKVLQKAQIVAYRQQTNVLNEKEIMANADHPFILKLHKTFQDKNCLYMLLELVQGGELFSLLHSKGGRLPTNDARFYSACVVDALEYLHGQDIVYRDLKPENLLIDVEGFIKVVDFGFAKKVLDKTFTLCGTPEYLAPELVLAKGHNRAVDYWAVGILIFEMLTGSSPFADHLNNDHMVICRNIVRGKVEYPKRFNEKAKEFVKALLVREAHLRLGMMKNGTSDIKKHPWFKQIDFAELKAKKVDAPWKPKVRNDHDTSNFEPYDEDSFVEPYVDNGSKWYASF